jgi:hypothetical protein
MEGMVGEGAEEEAVVEVWNAEVAAAAAANLEGKRAR